jgi:hypothetical protein
MLKRIKKITSEFQAFSEKAVPKRPARRRKIVFEEMERRVLLSADCIIPPQDLQEAADLLPDLIPALVECDGQVAESQLLAADNLEIEEAPVPADLGDGGLEPADKAATPCADAAAEAEDSAKTAAGQTEEADGSAPKDTMAEATEEDETAASDLQNTAESQQTTVDARADAAEDDGGLPQTLRTAPNLSRPPLQSPLHSRPMRPIWYPKRPHGRSFLLILPCPITSRY